MKEKQQTRAIGFLGGTFDPIHFGHLRPALEVSKALGLKQLFLMPNHIAPHKSSSHGTAKQRCTMVELAIQSEPNIEIDLRELTRHKASYTIDTLKELKALYPNTPLCFIMGMDSLINFDSWFQWQDILNYCHLIISHRPGWQALFNDNITTLLKKTKTLNKDDIHCSQAGKIYFQDTTQLNISSTEIRSLIKKHEKIDQLLPKAVADYIRLNKLYLK